MMTLWNIEQGLADLMEQRESALAAINESCADLNTPIQPFKDATAELARLDLAIAEYIKAEVRKVDGIRSMVKHLEMIRDAAKAEAATMQDRAKAADRQLQVLKSAIQMTMEEMEWREGKPRKLEGKTGSISLKGNGGKQPVVITDEALIPDEYRTVTVKMDHDFWKRITQALPDLGGIRMVTKEPSISRIAAALEEPCKACNGEGLVACPACGGSKRNGVPGAILAPRSAHIEVK